MSNVIGTDQDYLGTSRILNLPSALDSSEPTTLGQLEDLVGDYEEARNIVTALVNQVGQKAADADASALSAEDSFFAAEAVRDSVIVGSNGLYTSPSEGVSNTAVDEQFVVVNGSGWQLFKHDSGGTSTSLSGVFPSLSALQSFISNFDVLANHGSFIKLTNIRGTPNAIIADLPSGFNNFSLQFTHSVLLILPTGFGSNTQSPTIEVGGTVRNLQAENATPLVSGSISGDRVYLITFVSVASARVIGEANFNFSRELKSKVEKTVQYAGGPYVLGSVSGSSNALVASLPGDTPYIDVNVNAFTAYIGLSGTGTNTITNPTISIGGVVRPIYDADGGPVPIGSLVQGRTYFLRVKTNAVYVIGGIVTNQYVTSKLAELEQVISDNLESEINDVNASIANSVKAAVRSTLINYIEPLFNKLTLNNIDPGFNLPENLVVPIRGSNNEQSIFDYYPEGDLYFAEGTAYTSEDELFKFTNTTKDNTGFVVGPWISSSKTEHITNQEFDANIDGWETGGEATIAWSADNGGELQLNANGQSTAVATQKFPDDGSLAGKCFAITGTIKRGSDSSNSFMLAGSVQARSMGAGIFGTSVNSLTFTAPPQIFLNTTRGTNAYVGFRNTSGSGNGTGSMKEIDVREAAPLQNFPNGIVDFYVEFIAYEIPLTNQVLFQGDANTNRDRIRLELKTDGNIWFSVTGNNIIGADLNLGSVTLNENQTCVVAATNDLVAGCLNGQTLALDTQSAPTGISHLRVGKGLSAGEEFTAGKINRLSAVKSSLDPNWLKSISGGADAPVGIWTEGDSGMAGAYGVNLWEKIQSATGISTVKTAIGGSTWEGITDRIISAQSYLKDQTLVIFDLSANGFTTVEDFINRLRAAVLAKGDENWILIPPLSGKRDDRTIVEPEGTYVEAMKACRDAAIAEFGAHHVYAEIWEDLQALKDGSQEDQNDVDSGRIPGSLFYPNDVTHLDHVANDAIAAGVAPYIANIRGISGIAA